MYSVSLSGHVLIEFKLIACNYPIAKRLNRVNLNAPLLDESYFVNPIYIGVLRM